MNQHEYETQRAKNHGAAIGFIVSLLHMKLVPDYLIDEALEILMDEEELSKYARNWNVQ